jgi:multidrug transporter EmrE-like cation transporter
MKLAEFSLLMTGVLLNTGAQLLLKTATQTTGPVVLAAARVPAFAATLLVTPAFWAALVAYALSIGAWVAGLSRVPVSQAYPLLSIGYVITLVCAWGLFGETPSLARVAGVGLIVVGVTLVAAS